MAITDIFRGFSAPVTGPAIAAYAVVKSDTVDLPQAIRAITINGAGTLSFVSSRDGKTYTTGMLPIGTYPVFISRILSTGTTATDITGWA